jgi:para-nitrobenzyl esterase
MPTRQQIYNPAPRGGGRPGGGGAAAGGGRGAGPEPAPLPTTLVDLRALSTEDVQRRMRGQGMIVDGYVVPEDLNLTFAAGRQNSVDVLVGSNKDEGGYLPPRPTTVAQYEEGVRRPAPAGWGDLADEYLKASPAKTDEEATAATGNAFRDGVHYHERLYADQMAKTGKKAWLYFFTKGATPAPGQRAQGAVHAGDIKYVFNTLNKPRIYPDNSDPEVVGKDPEDLKVADQMSSYWVNFARTGDPNGKGLPPWPAYKNKEAGQAMVLGPAATPPTIALMTVYDKQYEKNILTPLRTAAATK